MYIFVSREMPIKREPCAEIGAFAIQRLLRNLFFHVTWYYRCYLSRRARFCYDDLHLIFSSVQLSPVRLRREETSLSPSVSRSGPSHYVSRFSFRRVKYPSSYPDFSTVPFCITTVNRPVNFSWANKLSVAALSNSNSCTLRRNSTKVQDSELQCFGSMTTSMSALLPDYGFESGLGNQCESNDLFLIVVMDKLVFSFENIFWLHPLEGISPCSFRNLKILCGKSFVSVSTPASFPEPSSPDKQDFNRPIFQ